MKEMGLRCQSENSLSGLLPTHHYQHSDGSDAEECVGGGFGDCSSCKIRGSDIIVYLYL